VREAAAQALCWLRAAGAIAPLTAALADPDLHVAAAAARALGACAAHSAQSDGTAAVVTGLIALFRRSDAACRNEALLALVSFGELAVPGLIQALADVDGPVRLGATDALAALGPRAEAAVPALLQQLGTEHVRERASAARALGAVGLHADVVVHQLAALLNDPAAYVRDAVLYALFLYGPRAVAAVPKLLVELERDSGPDGDRIASCLALIGPAALPALIRALALPNDRTRIRAAKALSLFGSQADPALAALIIALDNPAVRPYAAEALRSLSDAAKAQIPLRWAREVTQLRVERSG
jgi:HEAT repeat protein